MPPQVVLIGTRYPDLTIEEQELTALGVEVRTCEGRTGEEIVAEAGDADVVIAGARPRFDRWVIQRMKARGIVRAGIGVDSVDLEAAREKGIWVVNVPDYGTEAVALHTVALMLAGVRRLTAAHRLVLEGRWGIAELAPLHLPASLRLGIVGFGRIGRRVRELVEPLGFREVMVTDPLIDLPPEGCRLVSLRELVSSSEVITLHAPAPASGKPLIGPSELAAMKPGALLVNTGRGGLVDLDALVDGLRQGRPGWASLDVFTPEPPDPAALGGVEERLTLSPHMAWYSEETQAELRTRSATAAACILRGERPPHVVVGPE